MVKLRAAETIKTKPKDVLFKRKSSLQLNAHIPLNLFF